MGRPRTKHSWKIEDWDEGCVIDASGYRWVILREHPNANKGGAIRRSHAVWWLTTGEVVKEGYILHHKDGNKSNDIFSNLEEKTQPQHISDHRALGNVTRICLQCGKEFKVPLSYIRKGIAAKFCGYDCYHKFPVNKEIRAKMSASTQNRTVYA